MSQIPKASIYTKKGDRGTTSLVDGKTVAKNDSRVEAYGDVDELNSVLGVLIVSLQKNLKPQEAEKICASFVRIQNHLFNIGSILACEDAAILSRLPRLEESHLQWLESEIDLYNHKLPKLNEFILPGGHETSAWAHVGRTVCRRAERHVAALQHLAPDAQTCLIYLNRLSDFLFTVARWVHLTTQTPELKWDSRA